MTPSISIKFIHNDDDWRVMCHTSSGRCDIWKNGSFVRSATYVPRKGLEDHDGIPVVVPELLDRMVAHDQAIETAQAISP